MERKFTLGRLDERSAYSEGRFQALRSQLQSAESICTGRACVYATGSFGRFEASEHSDIDLFIVSLESKNELNGKARLSKLDEILIKADLVRTCRKLGFPEFSKDGHYLQHHTAEMLIEATGDRNDDATNTFTARLLLLLESRALLELNIHNQITDNVIAKYWREYPSHTENFMPAYLANDVLRFWRTLCLNYEASTNENTLADRAKRKIKNYKLKHSRMLTCYSAILYLLNIYASNGTVTVPEARDMVGYTPIQRVSRLREELQGNKASTQLNELIERYERFLDVTSVSEDDLIAVFSDDAEAHKLRDEQSAFGDLVFETLHLVGRDSRFYRRLVV